MVNDTISDMLTRIRNATLAKKATVYVPYTRLTEQIAQILEKEGFIQAFQFSLTNTELVKRAPRLNRSNLRTPGIGNSAFGVTPGALSLSGQRKGMATTKTQIPGSFNSQNFRGALGINSNSPKNVQIGTKRINTGNPLALPGQKNLGGANSKGIYGTSGAGTKELKSNLNNEISNPNSDGFDLKLGEKTKQLNELRLLNSANPAAGVETRSDKGNNVSKTEKSNQQGFLLIRLKYRSKQLYKGVRTLTKESCITNLRRISKPGLRIYTNHKGIPRILGGAGIVIISTPQGILTDREARSRGIGGEILCSVW